MATGDFDENGYADLAFVNRGSFTMDILLGDNHGSFRIQQRYSVALMIGPQYVVVVEDFNHDNMLNLAVVYKFNNEIIILLNTYICCNDTDTK
ncbi:hypothetical protein I4U23_000160 [Adineta vaga]|nr:hypothetical protein I4U23_000160 [Adineta vaga]